MLSIAHIGKTYANYVRALDGITLDVAPGEIVAVVGGSGCGKSTLLRLVSGLDTPTQGQIALDGDTILSPHQKIGIVFQEPRLLPWLTVAANVGFGLADRPKAVSLTGEGLPTSGPCRIEAGATTIPARMFGNSA